MSTQGLFCGAAAFLPQAPEREQIAIGEYLSFLAPVGCNSPAEAGLSEVSADSF